MKKLGTDNIPPLVGRGVLLDLAQHFGVEAMSAGQSIGSADIRAAGEPGINNEAAAYLASLNPMAVGADTWAVEVVPAANGDKAFYGHIEFLKHNGIYILETMNTGRLAREGVNEFMFVLGQARIKGTVQMIINPVAM